MLSHENLMRANEKDYVDSLPAQTRQELIKAARDIEPEDCLQCIFFKWLENEDGTVRQSCALGYDSEIDLRMRDKLCPVGGGGR